LKQRASQLFTMKRLGG